MTYLNNNAPVPKNILSFFGFRSNYGANPDRQKTTGFINGTQPPLPPGVNQQLPTWPPAALNTIPFYKLVHG